MTSACAGFGVVGLGTMGGALSMNLAEKTGSIISGFDLSAEKGAATEARASREGLGSKFVSFVELGPFVASLVRPRRIILLVPAGAAVDACLAELRQLLEAGDVVVDGGNEWYENTERREKEMAAEGIHYMGCGVSGGAEGARHGESVKTLCFPCSLPYKLMSNAEVGGCGAQLCATFVGPALMVGGPRLAWELVSSALTAVAARAAEDGKACVVYCGAGGAGNYVKMVHNGIEYGDMQLIGEAYAVLRASGRTNAEVSAIFERWNGADHLLRSFLVEITSRLLLVKEVDGRSLVDLVLDNAGSKGTGKWTVEEAANLGVPVPTISAALEARYSSALKEVRVKASHSLPPPQDLPGLPSDLERLLEDALVCSRICAYTQGLSLIAAAANKHGWHDLRLASILECWRGGCIIRAKLLANFHEALSEDPSVDYLFMSPKLAGLVRQRQEGWRSVVAAAILNGIPVPAIANSLAYYDSLRSPRLHAAALVQAQRDCFGSHTYKRIDKDSSEAFSSNWLQLANENAPCP